MGFGVGLEGSANIFAKALSFRILRVMLANELPKNFG
jgi:hypothetical protein